MKKILFLFLLVPVISYSQYTKKQLRKLKKMELKIVNRGLDLNATFVPYCTRISDDQFDTGSTIELHWEEALFSLGLDVGDYSEQKKYKDGNNREVNLSSAVIFKGRYIFDANNKGLIKIQDLNNNNKTVAIIKFKGIVGYDLLKSNSYKREYLISQLIKSNK